MPMYPNSNHPDAQPATDNTPKTALGGKDPATPKPEPKRIFVNSDHSEPLGEPNSSPASQSEDSPPSKPSPSASTDDAGDDPTNMHVPDAVRELRQDQSFNANETYQDALPDDVLTNDELTPELREAATREFRAMAGDLALPPAELSQFVTLAKWAESNPPTQEQHDSWRQDALATLEREFDDPAQALKDANALLRRDPRVRALIDHFGLGNHPSVVKMIAQRARSERAKGRL